MKSYFRLLNFELSRFIKIYLVLVGVTIISQVTGTILLSNYYMNDYNNEVYIQGVTTEQFLESYGPIGLGDMIGYGWYNYPIMFAASALILYSFFIWYRDWFGKNTFIYRLLMLPTARLNIFFSKATAIFLMVLGLVALQIILFVIGNNIVKWIIPTNLRVDQSIMELIYDSYGNLHFGMIIPPNFIEFLIHYGIGFTAVFVLFTAILFERSYRWKGFIYGVLYMIFAIVLFYLPELFYFPLGMNYLYPLEMFMLQFILWGIVTALSIWVSNYLLNKKITV